MKKYLLYIFILVVLIGALSPIFHLHAQTPTTPNKPTSATNYGLLAPINVPGGITEVNVAETDASGKSIALGKYLNLMIKIVIGLAAVMAVVMITIGGIEYMTSELISSKESGKEKIMGALFGLVIALSAYALLFTINPDLLNTDLDIKGATVVVTLDQANFAKTESLGEAVGTKYVTGSPNASILSFVQTHGTSLNNITINTGGRTASFCAGTNCISVPINVGQGGVAAPGQAASGDLKTPMGTGIISGDIRIASNGNAVISNNGFNLGAAFINLGIKDANGNDRGIGFHGSYNNSLGTTNGCIRMKNEDLIALAPYLKSGIRVNIR